MDRHQRFSGEKKGSIPAAWSATFVTATMSGTRARSSGSPASSSYLEGDDPVAGNRAFATSSHPFDVWFRARASEILGIDFTQPLPATEPLWDWHVAQVAV